MTVQGPVKKQQPDGMSHVGGGGVLSPFPYNARRGGSGGGPEAAGDLRVSGARADLLDHHLRRLHRPARRGAGQTVRSHSGPSALYRGGGGVRGMWGASEGYARGAVGMGWPANASERHRPARREGGAGGPEGARAVHTPRHVLRAFGGAQQEWEPIRGRPAVRGKRTYGGRPGQRVEEQGTWAAQKHSEAGYGRPVDRGVWTAETVKRPRQQPAHPQYANYWAPRTRKRHQQEH